MLLRPLWPRLVAPDIRSWSVFSDDLSELVQEQELVPVIAAGHSMGAVTALRAALRMPRLFEALVLLDPVLLPRRVIVAWWLARVAGLGLWLHPMTRRALKRRRHFDNLDQVFLSYRQREVFRNFTDEGLRVLIQGMMKSEAGSGYTLAYSPEWEARVYDTGVWSDWDLWNGLPRLRVPTLIVRGSDSDAFPIASAREVQNRNRRIQMRTVERASHLVPLEQPEAVFDLAREFLEAAEERVA
jgi:pimeloyl-ACP methyl ester carboxylesterase